MRKVIAIKGTSRVQKKEVLLFLSSHMCRSVHNVQCMGGIEVVVFSRTSRTSLLGGAYNILYTHWDCALGSFRGLN